MTHDLTALIPDSGVTTIAELTQRVSERSVRIWLKQGRLIRMHPGVVAVGNKSGDWIVRAKAAVLYTGGHLSHTSALALWGVIEGRPPCLHVAVSASQGIRGGSGLVVHRTRREERPFEIDALPVASLDGALIDSWSLLNRRAAASGSAHLARAAVITAVRSGRTTPGRLAGLATDRSNLPARSDLTELLGFLTGGCQSELEIWGVRRVLAIDGLPQPLQQYRVELPGGPVFLDAALPSVKLGIELDGAAFHGDRAARERDIARDAALAAEGWLILRFGYRRLTSDPVGCRRDIEAAYRRRLT